MRSLVTLDVLTTGRPCEVTFLPRCLLNLRSYLAEKRVMFPFVRGVIPSGFRVYAQHVVATPLAADQWRLAVAGDPNSPLCRRAATAWPTRSPRFIRASSSASPVATSTHLMRITTVSTIIVFGRQGSCSLVGQTFSTETGELCLRWEERVSAELSNILTEVFRCPRIRNWREKCQDRRLWNKIVKQAKTHQGL